MKQESIIRIVTQDGKLSFRKCMVDEDGDVTHVSSEPFTFKAEDKQELSKQMVLVQTAMSLPIITVRSNHRGGWLDQHPFCDDIEDDA